ncbi:MAG: hypothetical protein L6Q59_05895 [Ignavibacteriaceae bacterium]|nr:hypothetical protein [Ignavibacteriaceae bacterium]
MDRKTEELIEKYFDNELTKAEEIFMFTAISADDEAREYFRKFNIYKTALAEDTAAFPDSLDSRILESLPLQQPAAFNRQTANNPLRIVLYAASVVLLVLSLYLYGEISGYRQEMRVLTGQIKDQKETIDMLYNSYPTITIKPSSDKITEQ